MSSFGSTTLSVLLLDDQPAGRDLLRAALCTARSDIAIHEADSLAGFFAAICARNFDLVLVDLLLPDGSGLDALRRAAALAPSPLLLAVSSMSDQTSVIKAITAGAHGFLCKHDDPIAIAHAISIGLSGGATVTPIIACRLLQMLRESSVGTPRLSSSLTPRESEVLVLASKGFKWSEIAQMTASRPSTIYTHVRHIYDKLQVRCLSQCLHEARSQGLI
ncbi:response regulator transcription factor [Lysobacter terrae]